MTHIESARNPRFDFEAKLGAFPVQVAAALADGPGPSLTTVFFDLGAMGCNQDCIFCDGKFYEAESAVFTPGRMLELADEMAELGVNSVLFVGENTEPLTHRGFAATAERLLEHGVKLGIYTNGSTLDEAIFAALRRFMFVRVSLDAGTAETYQAVHRPRRAGEWERVLTFLDRVATARTAELGVSFVLLPENAHEIATAARVVRSLGAQYLEVKPFYTPEYGFDAGSFERLRGEMLRLLALCQDLTTPEFKVVVNRQIEDVLVSRLEPGELTRTAPRPCLTSKLRLVVNPRGCFLCPPYRGRLDKSLGNPRELSLREVWFGERHRELLTQLCDRRCVYHEQNELLLSMREGRAVSPVIDTCAVQPGFL